MVLFFRMLNVLFFGFVLFHFILYLYSMNYVACKFSQILTHTKIVIVTLLYLYIVTKNNMLS
jgi:hypothetical protein